MASMARMKTTDLGKGIFSAASVKDNLLVSSSGVTDGPEEEDDDLDDDTEGLCCEDEGASFGSLETSARISISMMTCYFEKRKETNKSKYDI